MIKRLVFLYTVLLLIVASLVIGQGRAVAQGPVIYLPFISKGPPHPYNVPAQELVLQPADVPTGYALNLDESGPIEFSEAVRTFNPASGYRHDFENDELLFSGTPIIASVAIVFTAESGARGYMDHVRQVNDNNPEATRISVPKYGQETAAYRLVSSQGLFQITAYMIAFRKGNIVSIITTGAFTFAADFGVAQSFAQKSLERINQRIQ